MKTGLMNQMFVRGLLVVLAGFSAQVLAAPPPDIAAYRLTEAALGKYEKATEAMYAYMNAHPELQGGLDEGGEEGEGEDDESIAAIVGRFDERVPGLRPAMERSGMSMEEYFTFTMVMAGNIFATGMAEHFGGADESALSALERGNMAFIRKNMARIQAFSGAMNEKYAHLMHSNDGEGDYEEEYDDEYYEEDH